MKDFISDYCIAAFSFYSCNGKSLIKYKESLYDCAVNESYYCNAPVAFLYERKLKHSSSEIADIEAVDNVVFQLQKDEKYEILRSIELVYFKLPKCFKRGDINNLIIKASLEIPASVRTVQRYLREARRLFAYERGLRT